MEGRRFNNVTMNERASERELPFPRPRRAASAEPRDRRLNCKITERGTMRPGITLCLHLNNPRARGYVILRALRLLSFSLSLPLLSISLISLSFQLTRAILERWWSSSDDHGRHFRTIASPHKTNTEIGTRSVIKFN